jgi:hypothetical protein
MKTTICLIICASLLGCSVKRTSKKTINRDGGFFLRTVDTGERRDIKIIHFATTTGVVFPSIYAKRLFGRTDTLREFFTPDTNLVRQVESKMKNAYCLANLLFNKKRFDVGPGANCISKPTVGELISGKQCQQWQKTYLYYDKQFLSFINKSGERVMLIQLIDFREDPHQLKSMFTNTWITGWHGWYYNNILQLHYHIDKDLFTIGEEI